MEEDGKSFEAALQNAWFEVDEGFGWRCSQLRAQGQEASRAQ